MSVWGDDDDDAPELVDARARAELAARWLLRHGPPSPEHYRAVMDALAAAELVDARAWSSTRETRAPAVTAGCR